MSEKSTITAAETQWSGQASRWSSIDHRISGKGGYSMDGLVSQIASSYFYIACLGRSEERSCHSQPPSKNRPRPENRVVSEWC
ncbi:hypothetical protein TNCV_1888931 [Trichonephila clavipes]|nr:hypothetical protein TNCV_1888931 [Trichonephila clavipes]